MSNYADLWLSMKQNGITQKKLAEHMNVSEQWISAVFNGKRDSKKMRERVETAISEMIKN